MRVLLVTSWDTPCGIADYAHLLKEYVERADPGVEVIPRSEALDPEWLLRGTGVELIHLNLHEKAPDLLIHINHHDGLHSRWTPDYVRQLTDLDLPVVVTYHDTTAGVSDLPSSDKLKAFAQVASSTIVHEPVGDVKAIYWRQGVPDAAQHPADYTPHPGHYGWMDGERTLHGARGETWKAYNQQPVLGTVGFNFPWKNYDRLCQVTAEVGWAMVILSNNATAEDIARWLTLNPSTLVIPGFLPGPTIVNYLAGCDATAFAYECANTGTSGAIRQGIAARKPVLAFQHCRQFRDLLLDPLGRLALHWIDSWDTLKVELNHTLVSGRYEPGIVALAHQDSWQKLGYQHAALYHALVHGAPL